MAKKSTPEPQTPWEQYQTTHPKPLAAQLPQLSAWRHKQLRRNLVLILTPLIVLLGFFGYMISPLAKVGEVNVTGVKVLPEQTIIDASQLSNRNYILQLLFDKHPVVNRVEKVAGVKSAHVKISGMNTVTLQISEYAPVGYVYQKGLYYLVLSSNQVVKQGIKNPSDNYPVLTGFTAKELPRISTALRAIPKAVRQDIAEVKATRGGANPYQVKLNMGDGNQVIADSRTLAKKMHYYPSVVADLKQSGTLDLEVGAFFTPNKTKKN
ncbi:cell division protein FtsQ/DivIB [Lacticaseibacillus brantae]|uniref:Cell division protein DivIB n=1 Tax=Lacticaseibacillus brantae DSM 23927 TaxID=1423727 RepID=A0A0R2AYV7_9LACO|nr:cell division protein FtsQ/DivIB [Lacticaseibacillus brantae]KRM72510.1 cell division protein, FtsQ [Lacticaseibacillus brantae DSM 23927]